MLQKAISIAEKIGRISAYDSLERMPILRRNGKISSIHSSLAIESNSLSYNQVRDVINGKTVIGPQREIQEVKNAFEAYEMMELFSPCDETDLIKAHAIFMKCLDDDDGAYRNHGEGVYDGKKLIFMAPPARLVPTLMKDLFAWLKEDDETPLLIKSCVFHYEFLFIHPFSDGNGRTARLWQNVLLSKWNRIFLYLPLESQIKEWQEEYCSSISKCNSEGNSGAFIIFMLDMILKALEELYASLRKESANISSNGDRLLSALDRDMPISANELMRKLGIKSKETLRNSYLNSAMKNGLIKMTIPDKPKSKNQKYYK